MNRIALVITVAAFCVLGSGIASGDIVAHWTLDSSGEDVVDGHDGVASGGVTFGTAGASAFGGTSASFANGVIDVPYAVELSPESFTIALWVRSTGGSGHRSPLTLRYDGAVYGGDSLEGMILYDTPGDQWEFWTGDGEYVVDWWDVVQGPAVETNAWAHLAITFDALTGTKELYVNGVLEGTALDQGYAPISGAPRDLHLGGGGDMGDQFRWVGDLDEVWLYDEVLSPTQIESLMVLNDADKPVVALTWDGTGDGNWGDMAGNSRWLENFTPVDWYPDTDTPASAVIAANTVTVAQDRMALNLDVTGEGVTIAAGRTLSVSGSANFASGTNLTLAAGATLDVFQGGSLDSVTTEGDAVVGFGSGTVPLATLDAAVGTFTKQGGGTLALNAVTATSDTIFKIAGGALSIQGADALGDATTVELAGGRLSVTPSIGGYGPGLAFGVVAGTDNMIDYPASPVTTIDLAETEGPIPANTTHVFYGRFYDQDNWVSFMENIQDHVFLMIDGETLIADYTPDYPTFVEAWMLLGNMDLEEGWHTFELRLSNESGAGGPADGLGFGWDVDGWDNYVHPEDPGDGSLFQSPTVTPIDLSAKTILVTADSTLDLRTGQPATVGPVIMQAGVLSTIGATAGMTFSQGTTIDTMATAVGFDPQVDTDYGVIANNSTGDELTIIKAGPSTWQLDAAPQGTRGTDNVTWEVREGTLKVMGETPLGSRPVTLAGGTLSVVGGIGTPGPAPTDGLVSHWTLDDGPGSMTVADSVGTSLGDLVNVADPVGAWVEGRSGTAGDYALQLDGIDDYVGFGTGPSLNGQTDFSVSAWIKTDTMAEQVILQQRNGGYNGEYQFMVNANGTLNLMLYGGGYQYAFATTETVNDGQWHHVAAVRAGESGLITIDGQLAATASGPIRNLDATIGVGMGADIRDNIRYFDGAIDEMMLYGRALDVGEIAAMVGVTTPDMSSTDLTVTADSTLSLGGADSVAFKSLTLQDGTLTTAGVDVSFGSTTIDAAADAVVGVNLNSAADLGPIDVTTPDPVTFVKTGPADLVLTPANIGTTPIGDNVTLDVRQAQLIAVGGPNPLGSAQLNLDGGDLVLAGTGAATLASFDNPVTVWQDATITAGTGGYGAPEFDVVLGSPANGLTLNGGILTLQTSDEYRLEVAGPLAGPSGLRINDAHVTLSGGGIAGSAAVTGGRLNIAADLELDSLTAGGGVVDTRDSQVTVTNRLKMGNVPLVVTDGAMTVSGSNLADIGTESLVTLSGGSVTMGTASIPTDGMVSYWAFDDGTGSAFLVDSVGANSGILVNMDYDNAWTTGHTGGASDGALLFDGSSYVEVAETATLTPDSFTFSAWARIEGGGYRAVLSMRDDFPVGTTYGYIMYIQGGNTPSVWTGNIAPWQGLTGPALPSGEWVHLTATFDAASTDAVTGVHTGEKNLYIHDADGNLIARQTAANAAYIPAPRNPFRIGAGANEGNANYFFNGALDDIMVYDRALSAEEVAMLPGFVPGGETLDLSNMNILVTADTTIVPTSMGDAMLGNVTLESGITLITQGSIPNFNSLSVLGDASITGIAAVRGTLMPEVAASTLNVDGSLELRDGAVFAAGIGSAANDQVLASGDIILGNDVTVQFQVNGADPFTAGTYLLMEAVGEEQILGNISSSSGLGQYVSQGPDGGLAISGPSMTITIEKDLNPGDADLSASTDLSDFNIWNANKFTSGTDWAAGDFNGDAQTDLSDFNIWNANKFTVATGGAAPAPTQVPEPGTLALLAAGLVGLLLARGRRRTR